MAALDTDAQGYNNYTTSIFDSPTFDEDIQIRVNEPIGSATIAPSGRDVALASKNGLYIIDLDSPFSPPRHLRHETPWTPADVQWSPFASRYYWVVSTSNQRTLVWNLELGTLKAPIEFVLHGHYRAVTDINFSPFHPDVLATCAVDGFVHGWDLRVPSRPAFSFNDWFAGASQVKWNRADSHIVASSHDRYLRIWDDRKGAIPLTSIEAHATKIYGVDWSRLDATKIITCSLDRTIKIWDHSISDVQPERIIRTPYPVWRARHTPFGAGILAMPQRGDDRLHLFNGSHDSMAEWDASLDPVYSFKGHSDSVKEFLWRARGSIIDNRDERDFQLISWGADNELILHKMREKYLSGVGYEKGMTVERSYPLTRRGSPYKSFRDSSSSVTAEMQGSSQAHGDTSMGLLTSRATMSRPEGGGGGNQPLAPSAIAWIKGVRIGKSARLSRRNAKKSVQALSRLASQPLLREGLSDEIIHISELFPKIHFEELDLKARRARVSLNGPWGEDRKSCFVELSVHFPIDYPHSARPEFTFVKTSAIHPDLVEQLEDDIVKIGSTHQRHHVGCLESVFFFLAGEKTVKQSVAWLSDDAWGVPQTQGDSSSDEDDALTGFANGQSTILNPGDSTLSNVMGNNRNVPLPKACGALWAPNGRLICFFPPKAEPASLFSKMMPKDASRDSSYVMLEGLGRLPMEGLEGKVASPLSADQTPELSGSENGSTSSSTSSSDSDEDVGYSTFSVGPMSKRLWQNAARPRRKLKSASLEGSQRTAGGLGRSSGVLKPKQIISIQDHDDILPSRRALAEEYTIFGSAKEVCDHNFEVAKAQNLHGIADIWSLLGFVLSREVPLVSLLGDISPPVMILAKRALVRIQRQDSGLDLSFDDPEGVSNPSALGDLRWGRHPFSSAWLIERIFDFFERQADLQMLAMLSCIMDDPPSTGGSAQRKSSAERHPGSAFWPGSTIPYFPNAEVAASIAKPQISVSTSDKLNKSFPSFGSMPSSDGSRTHEEHSPHPDLPTPLSTASTPPLLLSRNSTNRSSLNASLSVSPDNKFLSQLSANSSFAAPSWARPFHLSSSPPTRIRPPATDGSENLASSLPSSSGVTWGPVTVHSASTARRSFIRQESTETDSEGEMDHDTSDAMVKVTLTNATRFDEEGGANVPLLPGPRGRYVAYREAYAALLGAWGCLVQAAEVRKFNAPFAHNREAEGVLDDGKSMVTLMGETDPDAEGEGLEMVRCCVGCGAVEEVGRKKGRCARCSTPRRLLACTVCAEPVGGLHKACFNCGHVAHLECLRELHSDVDEEVDTCEAGCECVCSLHGEAQLEEVDLP